MKRRLFFLLTPVLVLCLCGWAPSWPPDTDRHPCYDPDDEFTWCNNDLPSQKFERFGTSDWAYDTLVTADGHNYHVRIKIDGVYRANGARVPDCDSAKGSPAAFFNTWTCTWNVGDPWFQNWDACPDQPIKMMLYCWPAQGCIEVAPKNPQSASMAAYLDSYLDTVSNMLLPAEVPPMDPPPAARLVYAMRPVNQDGTCPDFP